MKILALIHLILILSPPAIASPVIQKVGRYTSPNGKSILSIQKKGESIRYIFMPPEINGRTPWIGADIESSKQWAFLVQDEATLWIYEGGDTVRSVVFTDYIGPQLTKDTILQIKSERDLIPKELLEVIEKTPNKAPQPTTMLVTPPAAQASRQP